MIASDVTAPLRVTRGIERTFPRAFSETFRISKNEDFNGPYLENENEFLKNSFETVFWASKSCDRDQLVSAFQLTFNGLQLSISKPLWRKTFIRFVCNSKMHCVEISIATQKVISGYMALFAVSNLFGFKSGSPSDDSFFLFTV